MLEVRWTCWPGHHYHLTTPFPHHVGEVDSLGKGYSSDKQQGEGAATNRHLAVGNSRQRPLLILFSKRGGAHSPELLLGSILISMHHLCLSRLSLWLRVTRSISKKHEDRQTRPGSLVMRQ